MKRILSMLLAVLLLLTAVACKKATPEEAEQPSVYAVYEDIVAEFTELLTAKHNGEVLETPNTEDMDERETAIAEALYGIVDGLDLDATYPSNLGYGYKDMDGNGTPEMFLISQYLRIYAIFTLSDGEPILLESCNNLYSYIMFAGENRFLMGRYKDLEDSMEERTLYTCHLDGDEMVYDLVYGDVYKRSQNQREILERFQIVDGNRISIDEETFDELHWEHKEATSSSGGEYIEKLAAPYIHFPMNEPINTEGLPVADFSSYEAILKTYKAISDCYPETFNYRLWLYGEYDNLFAFPNDLAFEYYMQLFNTIRGDGECLGYDEIDLNGDGQDELVLLDEDYSIKAIFTQKDGVPVMWKAFAYGVCWLDEEGLIHVDDEKTLGLEYSLYEFTRGGEFNLMSSVLVTQRGRYLTRDGKTEKITFEESLEWYDSYCGYPEYVEPNEYTRDVSSLTYTPLNQPTKDPVQAAVGKKWSHFARLEETTGKNSAHGNTYVTFENVTETQMDLNFQYKFTYYYKDPNQESTVPGVSYYIPDTTESSLKVTARKENGVFVFDENGIKGRIEFGELYQWIIIEESTDERFPVGHHCYDDGSDLIS